MITVFYAWGILGMIWIAGLLFTQPFGTVQFVVLTGVLWIGGLLFFSLGELFGSRTTA